MTNLTTPSTWRLLLQNIEQLADDSETSAVLAERLGDFFRSELGVKNATVFSFDSSSAFFSFRRASENASSTEQQIYKAFEMAYAKRAPWKTLSWEGITVHSLLARGERVGLLAGEFNAHNEEELAFVLERCGRVLGAANDREAVLDRELELRTLYEIDAIRDQHLSFDEMLHKIMARMLELVSAEGAMLSLLHIGEGAQFFDRYLCGRAEHKERMQEIQRLLENELDDVVHKAFAEKGLVHAFITGKNGTGTRAVLVMPLILEEEILGGFLLLSQEKCDFSPRDKRVFKAICSQTDTAIFEDLQKQKLKNVFKRYVSRDVFAEMLKSDEDFLEGKRKTVTCFFSDLRGFTNVSEALDVSIVVPMLNEHLEAMTEIVFDFGGTVDKFIGDCVMAFFGAPLEQHDHVERAVQAAIAMRSKHNEIAEGWERRGLPSVKVGIGVHVGEVFVGNIGGDNLSSYTIIGDHVNLASRLEGVSGPDDIIISGAIFDVLQASKKVQSLDAEDRGEITVKGKQIPVRIYNVLGMQAGSK